MGEGKIKNFTDLKAWQEAHQLVLFTYKATKNFPTEEKFGLINQMRRAAISITSNISEGFARNSAKDKMQFYSISKGSLLELQNQIAVSNDLGYLNKAETNEFSLLVDKVSRLLTGLRKSAGDRK